MVLVVNPPKLYYISNAIECCELPYLTVFCSKFTFKEISQTHENLVNLLKIMHITAF